MRILLINPPVYDFSAFDFWAKPYGLLRIGGRLRGLADLCLFDFMDRCHPSVASRTESDSYGRGPYVRSPAPVPAFLPRLRRRYFRHGIPRSVFQSFLAAQEPFDVALIGSGMTYWYPGVQEVIQDLRLLSPKTEVILGGNYALLCPDHASRLGADLTITDLQLDPLWQRLSLSPPPDAPALWEAYPSLRTGVLKLTEGCPEKCTYCAVHRLSPLFRPRSLEVVLEEYRLLLSKGVRDLAFYDDALLYQRASSLRRFLAEIESWPSRPAFHTPNALHLRLLNEDTARLLVSSGFKSFFLGVESQSPEWLAKTGGKRREDSLASAADALRSAGAAPRSITGYILFGHPLHRRQSLYDTIMAAHRNGLRVMLSEFSPIPGTPDGEMARKWVDLEEPLWQNKSVFPTVLLGAEEVAFFKDLVKECNTALRCSRAAPE